MELEDDGYLSADEFEQIMREQMALYTQVCKVCRSKILRFSCVRKSELEIGGERVIACERKRGGGGRKDEGEEIVEVCSELGQLNALYLGVHLFGKAQFPMRLLQVGDVCVSVLASMRACDVRVRDRWGKGRERGGFRSRLLISISSSLVKISLDGGSCSKTTTMY